VRSAEGAVLGLAAFSPDSQISARVWSFEPGAAIDAAFFKARIAQAMARRDGLAAAKHTNALRLIHGESDGLPGLVVDRYADVLVAQFLAAGAERWRETILDALAEASACEAVFERSDAEVRKLEGLAPRVGFARGNREARRCPIIEYGLKVAVRPFVEGTGKAMQDGGIVDVAAEMEEIMPIYLNLGNIHIGHRCFLITIVSPKLPHHFVPKLAHIEVVIEAFLR
jgi:23S rRNA G2069 N7-methylase RlmK/C1962 C5-methylase RlmI